MFFYLKKFYAGSHFVLKASKRGLKSSLSLHSMILSIGTYVVLIFISWRHKWVLFLFLKKKKKKKKKKGVCTWVVLQSPGSTGPGAQSICLLPNYTITLSTVSKRLNFAISEKLNSIGYVHKTCILSNFIVLCWSSKVLFICWLLPASGTRPTWCPLFKEPMRKSQPLFVMPSTTRATSLIRKERI